MRTGPLQLAIDRVAGAMHEVIAEARIADRLTSRVVNFGAGDWFLPFFAEPRHRRFPRRPHRVPCALHVRIGRATHECHPRLVGYDGLRAYAGPEIEQHHVPRLEDTVGSLAWLVMGVRTVGSKRN